MADDTLGPAPVYDIDAGLLYLFNYLYIIQKP